MANRAARCLFGFGLAVGVLALVAGSASAGKAKCDDLYIGFDGAAAADWIECYSTESFEGASEGGPGHTARYEDILIGQGSHIIRISSGEAIEATYFVRQPPRALMDDMTELTDKRNWKPLESSSDYQLIGFSAKLWDDPVDCIGFVKYGAGKIGVRGNTEGVSSLLGGYDCWYEPPAPNAAEIEAFLEMIDD